MFSLIPPPVHECESISDCEMLRLALQTIRTESVQARSSRSGSWCHWRIIYRRHLAARYPEATPATVARPHRSPISARPHEALLVPPAARAARRRRRRRADPARRRQSVGGARTSRCAVQSAASHRPSRALLGWWGEPQWWPQWHRTGVLTSRERVSGGIICQLPCSHVSDCQPFCGKRHHRRF